MLPGPESSGDSSDLTSNAESYRRLRTILDDIQVEPLSTLPAATGV
jgi:hypothetical protein